MKFIKPGSFLLFVFCLNMHIYAQTEDVFENFTESQTKYIESNLPGMKPQLFLPNMIDYTKHHIHSAPAFSPYEKIMYFSVYNNYNFPQKIYKTSFEKGKWTKPELAEFLGNNQEGGPKFSPDGKRLYFYSKRPESKEGSDVKESRVWFTDIKKGKCSVPQLLKIDLKHGLAFYPSGFKNDSVLQISAKKGRMAYEDFDIKLNGGEIDKIYSSPEKFDISAATFYRISPFPNRDFVILLTFSMSERARLFISFKNKKGQWSKAKSMGDMINAGQARFPGFTNDMKYFFFSSYRSGVEKWYWIDAEIIDYLKNNNLNLVDQYVETVKNKGIKEAEKQYKKFTKKYNKYYVFDSDFYENATLKFIKNKNTNLAEQVLNEGLSKFFDYRLFILKGTLSEQDFKSLITQINKSYKEELTEGYLNSLGYKLLNYKNIKASEYIFELNTKLYPKSSNVYDSYAEVLLTKGDAVNSLKNYKKSLELNPQNSNAENVIKKIEKENEKK